MRLIYIEATAEEIRENKSLARTFADALNDICESIVGSEEEENEKKC